jgi:hypothetical protein
MSRAGHKWVDRHQKYVGEVSLHFEFGLNAVGTSRVPTDKNIKESGQHFVWQHLKNCLLVYINVNFFFLVSVWGTNF